ncbi:response regulator [Flaviaesturariibacter aridisoli]|uniref:Response regulator n=1 Tax=Flaviaesturariibacter aridisoli TaxID=2545761 RepID=A0A4R4DZP6_9BACT|nr:response regulator [Flaviaesturariibacter aridisoli]TCZ72219.1 response regulator [Flaviaesturariibacter aridisoli]
MKERNLHILHADDDADDRWLFEDGLRQCGCHTLLQFDDGEPLLNYIRGLGPAAAQSVAVICDMQMRRMGGVEVLCRVRELPGWEQTPVMIFSTSSFSEDIRTCLENGATGFYSKPNTLQESVRIIRDMIDTVNARLPA